MGRLTSACKLPSPRLAKPISSPVHAHPMGPAMPLPSPAAARAPHRSCTLTRSVPSAAPRGECRGRNPRRVQEKEFKDWWGRGCRKRRDGELIVDFTMGGKNF